MWGMLSGCVLPQGVGEQGDIAINSVFIAPETMDIRCLLPTDTPAKDHVEVTAVLGDISAFCGEVPCLFFGTAFDGRFAFFVVGCYKYCQRG